MAKSKYRFMWSDYQPHSTIEMNFLGFRDFRKYIWNRVDNIIQVSKENQIQCFHSTKDLDNDIKRGKMYLDRKKSKKHVNEMEKGIRKHLRFFRKLKKTKFQKLTNKQLISLLEESYERWEDTITFFRATQQEGTTLLMNKIKEKYSEDEVSKLITPVDLDLANKEQIDWKKIVKKPYFKKSMIKHAEKYPWMVMCHFTYEEVLKTLKLRHKEDSERKIMIEFEKKKKEIKKEQARLLTKHPELKPYVRLAQRLALSRMEVKSCWAGTDFYTIPLMQELAKRANEEILDFVELYLFDEIKEAIYKKKKISKEEKKRRRECFVGLWKNGKITYKSGKEAEKLAEKELGELYKTRKKDSLKGIIANPGKARGYVKIIQTNNVAQTNEVRKKFKKGDIMITHMTQPNIIDIVAKSAAIVTDEGGMLSHAAIISREFKIPCIVGTHTATQVFKDSDYVEVDANKGIIKRIK